MRMKLVVMILVVATAYLFGGDSYVTNGVVVNNVNPVYLSTTPVPPQWYMCFSNGVDHPVAVEKYVGGVKVETLGVMGTNTVRELMASGEVCKVCGHCWRGGRPGEGGVSVFADYHPNTNFRTCQICGLCQSQDTGWK